MDTTDVTIETRRSRGRPPITDGREFNDIPLEDQIERWARVTKVLRDMSDHAIENHFDMTFWGARNKCGTAGCAAGQCGLDPWFRRRGFSMVFHDNGGMHWSGLSPKEFFGSDGIRDVFTNYAIMFVVKADEDGEAEARKPRAQHRLALRAANQHLKSLKSRL